jgi:hypothetical protein
MTVSESCWADDSTISTAFEVPATTRSSFDHLYFVEKPLGEQGTKRPVNQAGNQRLLFTRTTLATEKAARDAAGCKGLFLIIDSQRKEVLAWHRFLVCDRRNQHDGIAHADDHSTTGLPGDLASLDAYLMFAVGKKLLDYSHNEFLKFSGKAMERGTSRRSGPTGPINPERYVNPTPD